MAEKCFNQLIQVVMETGDIFKQMKILWIVNTVFPEFANAMSYSVPVSGSWMYALAKKVKEGNGVSLYVATEYSGINIIKKTIDGICYILVPRYRKQYFRRQTRKGLWALVHNEIKPDIVHIHGTEYAHGLQCMHERPEANYVISIQGLVSEIYKYYYANITRYRIIRNMTLRDILKRDTIFHRKNNYRLSAKIEHQYFEVCSNVIGRTKWDKDIASSINQNIKYYHCGEMLSSQYYLSAKWSVNCVEKYSIFISQGSYPIKGLHKALIAVSSLKSTFPDIKLRIAGHNIVKVNNRLIGTGYGEIIRQLINQLKLVGDVEFTGSLNVGEMINEYRRCHVFLCPSRIENSPNSVGEAQILGVPTIATNVGGIPDMVEDNVTGLLYEYGDVLGLQNCIENVFNSDSLAMSLSNHSIIAAEKRHNRTNILECLMDIYSNINTSGS
jgi:L-malate glycosyltransferase